jgi:hypothetical protein
VLKGRGVECIMGRARLRCVALNLVRLLAGSAVSADRKGPAHRADVGVECGTVANGAQAARCCNLLWDCVEPQSSPPDPGAGWKGAGRGTPRWGRNCCPRLHCFDEQEHIGRGYSPAASGRYQLAWV